MFSAALFVINNAMADEIIATIPPLAGLVKMLDPEDKVACLLTAGSDPHHFQLSPRQVENIGNATLLVRSSRADGSWLQPNIKVTVINLWPESDHAWLSPDAVANALPELAEALIAVRPQQAGNIRKNLSTALTNIARTNTLLAEALEPLKDKGVIMQHPSWRRLFAVHGVPLLGILESDRHGHEHGPRHLDNALALSKQHPDAVLVGDLRHSNRSLQWLSGQADDKPILYLDGLGNCGNDWIELMQQNIDRIMNR